MYALVGLAAAFVIGAVVFSVVLTGGLIVLAAMGLACVAFVLWSLGFLAKCGLERYGLLH